ncbi:MAG: ATP synthase F1 subunit gamma [Tissierellia bacterium]|nr:ATP synthase F1 subunit gamma [Tissierellia bacterium]
MAQTMKEIKRRIGSVGNIMQITNAMELVSSAKLRKIRQRLETTRPYFETVYANINEILAESDKRSSIYLDERPVKNRAVIVCASDRGLAGGYNINVCKKALEYKDDSDIDTTFYVTGVKAYEILKRHGCKVNLDYTVVGEDPEIADAVEIGSMLLEKYAKGEIDEVNIVYTKFESVLKLVPQAVQLLPTKDFKRSSSDDLVKDNRKTPIIYEPSAEAVLAQMIEQYVNVSIYGAILEASTSEQASRRTAMENATDNGKELLEDLELIYNRARQANITQEISEIVGGAEALK